MASKQPGASGDPIPKVTIVHSPDSAPLKSIDFINEVTLPAELVETFNRAFFFHLLANDPSKVIPPGKSITSVLSRPNTQPSASERPTLKEQMETVVHRAFWDEVLQFLSNPAPSMQLSRLKKLYDDLHLALGPLLPPNHPVIATLSSPLSPTSSPLLSAVTHLREVLQSLRERCAPIRDEAIDALIRKLDDPPISQLPHVIVDVVRSIHQVSDIMKDDLSQVTLGSLGERQLKALITSQAKEEERELVVSLWRLPRIRSSWKAWLEEVVPHISPAPSPDSSHRNWILRLMKALTTNAPVSCDIPTYSVEISEEEGSRGVPLSDPVPTKDTSPNPLPPPLFFATPTLRKIQDYLQALVIAASLRSLIRLPPTNPHTNQGPPESDLIKRVWTLLRAEIEGEEGADGVKLENLADEIIRIRQRVGGTLEPEEEARLRAAVDRTVQPRDPVFILLHKRLSEALSERLTTELPAPTIQTEAAPKVLQTGRRARGPPHVELDGDGQGSPVPRSEEKPLVVKGFEDPVLLEATTEVLKTLGQCVGWTESVWRDVVVDATH